MPEKKRTFDRIEFIAQFKGALNQIDRAEQFGREFANQGINRIFFVGCGAPYYLMRLLAYWGQKAATNTDIRVCYSAEFVTQNPAAIDENTLVILGSHSGTTKETLEAAKFLKSKPCRTLSITQDESSPLGKETINVLPYSFSKQGYFSSYILAQTLFSAFLNTREKRWTFHPALMESLPNLPSALADAKEANLSLAAVQASGVVTQSLLYVIGAGPMYTTAFVFAACFLMEMQWLHAHALTAADFFHGPFEVIDKSVPIIVLIGEDPSRPEAERVKHFCEKYAGPSIIYDSQNFKMAGINSLVRPIVAPFIIDSALTSLVEELAILRDHPLTTRRYMGKVDY
jgi:fructoselysine 6-phosphate deglycase